MGQTKDFILTFTSEVDIIAQLAIVEPDTQEILTCSRSHTRRRPPRAHT
jgi:hypothetical protein